MRALIRNIASAAFAWLAVVSGPVGSATAATVYDVGSDTDATQEPSLVAAQDPNDTTRAFTDTDALAFEEPPADQDSATADVSSDAIHAILASLRLTSIGLVSGDTVIANSQALIQEAVVAVPEPAVWLQLIAGFGLVGLDRRRRRRADANWRRDAAGVPRT